MIFKTSFSAYTITLYQLVRITFTSSSINPLLDCDHVSFGWILSVVALPKSHNLISPLQLSSRFSTCTWPTQHSQYQLHTTAKIATRYHTFWWEKFLANHTGKRYCQGKIWWISYSQCICQIHFRCICEYWRGNFWKIATIQTNFPLPKFSHVQYKNSEKMGPSTCTTPLSFPSHSRARQTWCHRQHYGNKVKNWQKNFGKLLVICQSFLPYGHYQYRNKDI